jgi:hypothetical protein
MEINISTGLKMLLFCLHALDELQNSSTVCVVNGLIDLEKTIIQFI